ncbi:MAG: ATP-binding cassette domain-containing protein [Desulfobacterales bacterium]
MTKSFKGAARPALDDIHAVIRPGIITGLAGPDGSGKTTLMRLLAGLLAADRGTITVDGLDAVKDTASLHQILGYMPQRFGLYEDLSVLENLRLYADLRGVAGKDREKTFKRLLNFTGLEPFTSRLAHRLSGGMKQKLGLACTLIKTPKVLLLDEPSVGVDPISRRELWRMVRELVDEDIAVLWSTSYLDEAEQSDEVLLLNEGRLLFDGNPADLTGRVAGRVIRIEGLPEETKRQVLANCLRRPDIIDGVVQGRALRLVMKPKAPLPSADQLNAGPHATVVPVSPRFEDAFIDILGGGPGGDSQLADQTVPIQDDGKPVVEAHGLTKRFGSFTAVRDNTFSIRRGEIFGLLGPNGAGKSTTFKMMCGLLKPTEGDSFVAGVNLRHSPGKARSRLGYMAQKFSLYGNLTVRQNLNFFSGVYGLKGRKQQETIGRMIEAFDLGTYTSAGASELPLGFKQRLALACAVMHAPDVLFLDEPTSGVDPITRREFWTHINGLVEKGVTVLVTTHFMDEAEYCDRIGLIFRGEKIAEGSPDELKKIACSESLPDPTLEDAFIELVRRSELMESEGT